MKHTTGASKVDICKPLFLQPNEILFSFNRKGRVTIQRFYNSNESIAKVIVQKILPNLRTQGRNISFLWTNGTKKDALEIASAMGSVSATVLENTSDGINMERVVKQRLREFDNKNGGLLRDVPDDELWSKMFGKRFDNPEIDILDRRLDKISDILEKHKSPALVEKQDELKARINDLISLKDRPYYELRRELVSYQREVSKRYATKVQSDFVILIRKKGEKTGTANNAELRTIYRFRKSVEQALKFDVKFVDAVIEI